MLQASRVLFSSIKPLLIPKNVSFMATLSSPTSSYTGIVSETLTRVHNKYHYKDDITFAKTACQAAKFLDDYLTHSEHTDQKENSIFLCHIYHMFAELIFNTLEIVETDHHTTTSHDLENIHYNIYTNTHFNKHCGSEKGPHGETSLFMISYIAQKIKFDYNITLEEFKRHAYHVDEYIEQIMAYLRENYLNESKSPASTSSLPLAEPTKTRSSSLM